MAKTLDVYRDWLQIAEPDRPPNHYQLLRLKKFEDDSHKIREHYRKLNAHVRKFATGEFAVESQQLLNELAKAMLCLTDVARKRDYDGSLGRAGDGSVRRQTMEDLLLAAKAVDANQLVKARQFAKAIGVDVRDALIQQKLAKPDVVMPAYAESIGLPFLDLNYIEIDPALVPRVPAVIARTHSCVPVLIDDNQLLMASPNPIDPQVEEELRLRFGMPIRTVLCLPASLNELVNKHYSRDALEAEKSTGSAARASAPAAVAAKGERSADAPAQRPAPDTPEQQKQRKNVAIMTFCFSVAMYQVVLVVLGRSGLGWFLLGFPLAGIVAASVWGLLSARRK